MRTFAWILKALQSVLSSRSVVIVAVFSAGFIVSPDARADNQHPKKVSLSACCGVGCATASCNGDAELYLSSSSETCSPDCYMTAILIQPDSSVSGGCGVDATSNFRFVRESSPCIEDDVDPFFLPFPLNNPFLILNFQWIAINGANIVVEADTDTPDAEQQGEPEKTSISSSTEVPAASTWGLCALGVLVLSGGTLAIRRRSVQSTA